MLAGGGASGVVSSLDEGEMTSGGFGLNGSGARNGEGSAEAKGEVGAVTAGGVSSSGAGE